MDGRNFLLSFLHHRYNELSLSLANELAADLRSKAEEAARNGKRAMTDLEMITWVDLVRRRQFWESQMTRIQEKYCATYILIRTAGSGYLKANFCAISSIPDVPNQVAFHLVEAGENWSGALLVNNSKFGGVISRRSTDKLLEPTTLTILRSESLRDLNDGPLSPPVGLTLSGSLCGWRNDDEDSIITTAIAMVRRRQLPGPITFDQLAAFKSQECEEMIAAIDNSEWGALERLDPLLAKRWFRMKNIGARDALGLP